MLFRLKILRIGIVYAVIAGIIFMSAWDKAGKLAKERKKYDFIIIEKYESSFKKMNQKNKRVKHYVYA